jgi:hypothetical protein
MPVARAQHHPVVAKLDRPLIAVGRQMADVQNGPAGLQFDSLNVPLRPGATCCPPAAARQELFQPSTSHPNSPCTNHFGRAVSRSHKPSR